MRMSEIEQNYAEAQKLLKVEGHKFSENFIFKRGLNDYNFEASLGGFVAASQGSVMDDPTGPDGANAWYKRAGEALHFEKPHDIGYAGGNAKSKADCIKILDGLLTALREKNRTTPSGRDAKKLSRKDIENALEVSGFRPQTENGPSPAGQQPQRDTGGGIA